MCLIAYAAPEDTILTLNRMKIADVRIVHEIEKFLPDIRNTYNITAPSDTFLINFLTFKGCQYFTVIAKNRHKVCKYEIPETEVLGYTIIDKNVFIICGEELIKLKRKKKGKINFQLNDIPPAFDGFPPMWTFKIEKKKITLFERYIPKGNIYHIKFP